METPHEILFQNIPGNLNSTSLLINWPLGISKYSLFKLKLLARYALNLFPVWIFPWIAQYSVILRQNTWTYPEVMYIVIWVKASSYSWGSIFGKVKSWILFSIWTWHISYLGIRYNIFILYNDSIILEKKFHKSYMSNLVRPFSLFSYCEKIHWGRGWLIFILKLRC